MSAQPSRFLAVLVASLMIGGFLAFVAGHALRASLVDRGSYEDALASTGAYRRLYADVLADEELAPQVDRLLGGVEVEREDVEAQLEKIAPEPALRALAGAGIDGLIAYFEGGPLVLALDLTPIIAAIHDVVVAYVVAELSATPVERSSSYPAFLDEARAVVRGLQRGELPAALPTHPIPPGDRDEVKAVLIVSAGLDRDLPTHAEAIGAIERAVDEDRVHDAFKVAALGALDPLVGETVDALTDTPLVHRDGDRFVLAPPDEVTKRLARRLAIAQTAGGVAGWARLVGLAAVAIGAGAMLLLFRRDLARALRWLGAPLIAAGAIGFVAWLVGRGIAAEQVGAEVGRQQGLPPSVRAILRDVAVAAVDGLTPSIWIPSLIVIGLGSAALAASFLVRRG